MLKKFFRNSLILAGILAICIMVTSPASYAITLESDKSHQNTMTQSSGAVKYVSESEDDQLFAEVELVKPIKTDQDRDREALLIAGAIIVGITVITAFVCYAKRKKK